MSKKPLISVVMPVYNQEKYLAPAVESILRQSLTDYELIIVDDGSTDETLSVVKDFDDARIHLVEAKHGGFLATLQKGVETAEGRWIARMDSDDICHPRRLENQIAFLNQHPECSFVTSIYGIITPNNRYLEPLKKFDWRYLMPSDITLATHQFCDPATVVDREKALEAGYDAAWENEKPLWYKLLERGRGAVTGEPIYYIRWLLGSHSRSETGTRRAANDSIRAKYDTLSFENQEREPLGWQKKKFSAAGKCFKYYLAADDFAAAGAVAGQMLKKYPFHAETWKMAIRFVGRINGDVKENVRRSKFSFAKVDAPW